MKKMSIAAAALLVAAQIGSVNAAPAHANGQRAQAAEASQTAPGKAKAAEKSQGFLRSLDMRAGQQGERASQGKANKGGNSIY